MHDSNFDLGDINKDSYSIKLDEISKIEGAASLEIKVTNGKVEDLKFSISEWKRFYTQAIQGKLVTAIPPLVARICGTCSNAHLLASLEAVENALAIKVSDQTLLLRKLFFMASSFAITRFTYIFLRFLTCLKELYTGF